MIEDRRSILFRRYLDGELTAEHAADLLGPGVTVAEVILETRDRFGRIPERSDAFVGEELRRAVEVLGLKPKTTD